MKLEEVQVRILGISTAHNNTSAVSTALLNMFEASFEAAQKIGRVETELVELSGKQIKYCTQCEQCLTLKLRANGKVEELLGCSIRDDMQEIYEKILPADAIIFGSPVHMGGISSLLRIMFDRFRWLVHQGLLRWKVGGALVVSDIPLGGQERVLGEVIDLIRAGQMIQVGFPYGGVGTAGLKNDTSGIRTAKYVGRSVAEAAKIVKVGLDSLPDEELHKFIKGAHRFAKVVDFTAQAAAPRQDATTSIS